MFAKSSYINRRQALVSLLRASGSSGILAFAGNAECGMSYRDNSYKFRQDSSFLYFFGIDQPDLGAILDLESGESVLYADDAGIDTIVWTGSLPTAHELAELSGISKTAGFALFEGAIVSAKASGRKIHCLPAYRAEHELRYQRIFGPSFEPSVPLIKAIIQLRELKSAEEICEIELAVATAHEMHLSAARVARMGMKESQIVGKISEIAQSAGGDLSFPAIATIHGETLHNHFHGNELKEGQLFLLDSGAETASHYASDLTTTFPISRKFTAFQRDMYEITRSAHFKGVEALKPGNAFLNVHLASCLEIAEGLKSMGIMKGSAQDAVAAGAHTLFFPCGTGHMMGLDVHDMENLGELYVGYEGKPRDPRFGFKSLRLAKAVQPGFVVTVEPGIYFIPDLIDLRESEGAFKDFVNYDKLRTVRSQGGCRLEEDYLVSQDGSRLLGAPGYPLSVTEVEDLRGS